jgi:hypothetical protein
VAGDVIASDPVLVDYTDGIGPAVQEKIRLVVAAFGAATTIAVGGWLRSRRQVEGML